MPLERVTLVNRGTGSARRSPPAASTRSSGTQTDTALQEKTETRPGRERMKTADSILRFSPGRRVQDGNKLVFNIL